MNLFLESPIQHKWINKIGRKVIDSKDVSVKWIYCSIEDYKVYKVNLKLCASYFKRLRTVLLNTLCWISDKIVVEYRH